MYATATPFMRELLREVRKYFKEKNVPHTGDTRLRSKTIVLCSSVLLVYLGIAAIGYFHLSNVFALTLCLFLGINYSLIGFNVMHDGSHNSYSKNQKTNYGMALSLNAMGADAFMWKIKHCVLHHGYTNITGLDDDIDQNPYIRLHPKDPWRPLHPYQCIYGPLILYPQEYWHWVVVGDFRAYFTQKIGTFKFKENNIVMSGKDHLAFWGGKLFHIAMMFILPLFVFDFSFLEVIIGYLAMTFTCGFFISIVFQLAHIGEASEFYSPEEAKEISWEECQIRTTSNFGTNSKLLSWLLGGLNFQIEHHLLPHVSHVHYPALAPIVENLCKKYGWPYHNPPAPKAVRSHIRYLYIMGKKPQ